MHRSEWLSSSMRAHLHADLFRGGGTIRADKQHGRIELDLALLQVFCHHVEEELRPIHPRPEHVAIIGRATSEFGDGLSILGVTTVVMRTLVKGIWQVIRLPVGGAQPGDS